MADPIRISIIVTDSGGKTAPFPVLLPSTATLAEINATAVGMATLVDAASGARVTSAVVELPIDIAGATIKALPMADSRVSEGWNLVFQAAGTSYSHAVRLPCPPVSKHDGYILDNEDADIAALITGMTGGIAANPDPTDGAGRDLTAFRNSRFSKRKVSL